MMSDWRKAAQGLSDACKEKALNNLLEDAPDKEAGIIRQLLGAEKKPLSTKQQFIYDKSIEEALVEKCGNPSCGNFSLACVTYCPVCEVEFGE